MMATETVQIELYTRFKNLVSINKTNNKKGKKMVQEMDLPRVRIIINTFE